MTIPRTSLFGPAAILLSIGAVALPAAAAPARNVVLVHGALVDGAGWRGVYDILTKDGYHVSVIQEPLTGLAEDVAATKRVIDRQDGPTVLVGHSYGGTIITAAGDDPKVKALVYVAALQPDKGESTGQLVQSMPAMNDDIHPTKDGFLFLDPAKFPADFGADLPKDQAEFMAHSQMPVAAAAFGAPVPVAAWHGRPSFGIVAADDKTLNPDLQRSLYKRGGDKVTEIKGSHALYISQAAAVAKVIEDAAKTAP